MDAIKLERKRRIMIKKKVQKPLEENPIGDFIPVSRLRRITELFKDCEPQEKVTFEFLIASCFPRIYENINERLTETYIKGYNQGAKDERDQIN